MTKEEAHLSVMGDLMHKAENQKMWNGMEMKKVNHLSAEGDVIIIGVDRYDVN